MELPARFDSRFVALRLCLCIFFATPPPPTHNTYVHKAKAGLLGGGRTQTRRKKSTMASTPEPNTTQSSDDDEMCVICRSPPSLPTTHVPCNHVFCLTCTLDWYHACMPDTPPCPLCKAEPEGYAVAVTPGQEGNSSVFLSVPSVALMMEMDAPLETPPLPQHEAGEGEDPDPEVLYEALGPDTWVVKQMLAEIAYGWPEEAQKDAGKDAEASVVDLSGLDHSFFAEETQRVMESASSAARRLRETARKDPRTGNLRFNSTWESESYDILMGICNVLEVQLMELHSENTLPGFDFDPNGLLALLYEFDEQIASLRTNPLQASANYASHTSISSPILSASDADAYYPYDDYDDAWGAAAAAADDGYYDDYSRQFDFCL